MAKIGRYELVRELGRGRKGVVYLARDPLQEPPVAVRIFEPPDEASPEQLDEMGMRFLCEARSAAVLGHPGIAAVREVGEDAEHGGVPFIVMDYVEGHTLRYWLDRIGRLFPQEAFPIAETLADALETAHASGILHRDINPSNILICEPDGSVKIADFGVVRWGAAEPVQPGTSPDAIAYLAPEQLQGRPPEASSDLFSLAVILYECLCGERPFQDESFATPPGAVLPRRPAPISGRVEGLSPVIDTFFERALATDPGKRFPSGAAFRDALKQARLDTSSPDFGTSTMPVASLEAELDAARAMPGRGAAGSDFRARDGAERAIRIDRSGDEWRRFEEERRRLHESRGPAADRFGGGGPSQPGRAAGQEERRARPLPGRAPNPHGRRTAASSSAGRRNGEWDRRASGSASGPVKFLERHWPLALACAFASFALTVALWRISRLESPPGSVEAPGSSTASTGAVEAVAKPTSDSPRPPKESSKKSSNASSSRTASAGGPGAGVRSASLKVIVRSRIPSGTLTVLIDGERVLARRLAAPEDSKKLMNRLRGRGQETYETSISVAPGPHRVMARLRTTPDDPAESPVQKEDGVRVELKAGDKRTVRIVAGGTLGAKLSMKLE